jgi:hypothetical protein
VCKNITGTEAWREVSSRTGKQGAPISILLDHLFMICSYGAVPAHSLLEAAVDNRINEIRRTIRALRVTMLEAEAIMRDQINRDEDCSFVADELLKMRCVMSLLVQERATLGDREPILVNGLSTPRRRVTKKPAKPFARLFG